MHRAKAWQRRKKEAAKHTQIMIHAAMSTPRECTDVRFEASVRCVLVRLRSDKSVVIICVKNEISSNSNNNNNKRQNRDSKPNGSETKSILRKAKRNKSIVQLSGCCLFGYLFAVRCVARRISKPKIMHII